MRLQSQTLKNAGLKSWVGKGLLGGLYGAGMWSGYSVYASDDVLHPKDIPWYHHGLTASYDAASMRRGFEVYRQVCSTCHSLELIAFRNLIGNTHTETQAKLLAKEYEIPDGPNDEGEMFERPGKLSDYWPKVYANDEYARFINGGALPPDLSCIVKARHSGDSYIFSLLTGYCEPPAGISVREGLHYNPYFPGGAIGMAPPLLDGVVEYDCGTPSNVAQNAKDVVTFLSWASEPEMNERKLAGIKCLFGLAVAIGTAGYYKRWKWSIYKTRRISYVNSPGERIVH